MDTTETYIKMCDCKEIQTEHEWVDGDLYSEECLYRNGTTAVFNEFYCGECDRESELEKAKWLWLPRQDQLQEMAGKVDTYELLDSLYEFCGEFETYPYLVAPGGATECLGQNSYTRQFTSMEQLWLAFVMKEKFNKVWDREAWRNG